MAQTKQPKESKWPKPKSQEDDQPDDAPFCQTTNGQKMMMSVRTRNGPKGFFTPDTSLRNLQKRRKSQISAEILKALEVRHRLAHDQCDQTARIFFDSWLHTYLLTHAQ